MVNKEKIKEDINKILNEASVANIEDYAYLVYINSNTITVSIDGMVSLTELSEIGNLLDDDFIVGYDNKYITLTMCITDNNYLI